MKIPFLARLTLCISALMACAFVNADDLHFFGFSSDGTCLAFENSGVGDGSGAGYASISFVDVARNRLVGHSIHVRGEKAGLDQRQAIEQARREAGDQMQHFRIQDGTIGRHPIHAPLPDNDCATTVRSSTSTASSEEKVVFDQSEIILKRKSLTATGCTMWQTSDPKGFTLTVINKENGKSTILQDDVQIPASRDCAFFYRMSDVYAYKGFIAVFLEVFQPGFENCPNVTEIVVTGRLP